jgi:hypothetical protein
MNHTLIAGVIIVNLALIFYTIAFIIYLRTRLLSKTFLIIFHLALSFDIIATCCMVAGSSNFPFTLHGFIGYSALLAMIIEAILIWKLYLKNGFVKIDSPKTRKYTVYAYVWWVVAYISGAIISSMK